MKADTQKIRFAVVGCGHIGLRHAEMVVRNEEAQLVALVDVRNKHELDVEQFNVSFYQSLEDLLASGKEVDVINIATPNGLHATQALQALGAQKHVVIEKPMTIDKQDAQNILDQSVLQDKRVFVVMQNRYSPPSVWIKDLLGTGRLGDIYMVQLNCYWNRDHRYYKKDHWHGTKELDGGVLFTQFSHFIDMMYWLFGDIRNIQARFSNFNHLESTEFEDSGLVSFEFVNGGIGSLNYSTSIWDQNMESSMTIIAEHGSVKIGGQYMNEVIYCHIKDYQMPLIAATNPGNDYGAYKGSSQNHHYMIENVVDVLKGRAPVTANAFEGMKVVDIIERIYVIGHSGHG